MAYIPTNFSTTAVINADTLFQNYDDEVQVLMSDVGNYLSDEIVKVYTETEIIVTDGIKVNSVETIEDLATQDVVVFKTIIVKDFNRGGTFIWSATGTANGGTVFAGVSGYWNRQYSGAVNVKWFGANGDGITNDKVAIQNAIYFIRTTQDVSSYWYSDKVDSILYFPNGTYKISGTVLTVGNIRIVGDGTTIISDNNSTTPVFETAYINNGVWTSNADLPVNTLLADAITNLKFENLTFRGVGYVFKLRGAVWQCYISNCAFYYCGVLVTANNCFYFNYSDIMVFGTKGSEFNNVARFQLSEAVNRISLDRVSISNISSEGSLYGIGISISGIGADLSITNSSFEVMNTAIKFTDKFYNFNLESTYFEYVNDVLKDTDGAIKIGFNIDVPTGYGVGRLIDGSGFRNTIIKAYQDRQAGNEYYRGVVKLTAGTNGNRGTIVYMDSSFDNTISTSKYQVTSDVELIPCDWQLQHGSNANGTYTKFPNGVLIQNISKVIDYTANTNVAIPLPIAFKDMTYSATVSITFTGSNDYLYSTSPGSNVTIYFKSANTITGNKLNITAIGRWK